MQQPPPPFLGNFVVRSIGWMPESLKQRVLPNKILLFLHRKKTNPRRIQRVYLKYGTEIKGFLRELNNRKVEYVLLRWWEDLPLYPALEDINLLVRDADRDRIKDLVSEHDSRGRKCDIYTLCGSKNGSRFGIPVFPYNLAISLLNSRTFYKEAYVPAPLPYFASTAYHAILHKGKSSGVPGFEDIPAKLIYDYTGVLKKMASDLDLQVEITVTGLYSWLKQKGFAPGNYSLRKLVEEQPELSFLETHPFSHIKDGDLNSPSKN